jgi:hypothetical protein
MGRGTCNIQSLAGKKFDLQQLQAVFSSQLRVSTEIRLPNSFNQNFQEGFLLAHLGKMTNPELRKLGLMNDSSH